MNADAVCYSRLALPDPPVARRLSYSQRPAVYSLVDTRRTPEKPHTCRAPSPISVKEHQHIFQPGPAQRIFQPTSSVFI
jgi:hypothetical protein